MIRDASYRDTSRIIWCVEGVADRLLILRGGVLMQFLGHPFDDSGQRMILTPTDKIGKITNPVPKNGLVVFDPGDFLRVGGLPLEPKNSVAGFVGQCGRDSCRDLLEITVVA